MTENVPNESNSKDFTGYHWISDTTLNVVHYNLSFLEVFMKTLPLISNEENN